MIKWDKIKYENIIQQYNEIVEIIDGTKYDFENLKKINRCFGIDIEINEEKISNIDKIDNKNIKTILVNDYKNISYIEFDERKKFKNPVFDISINPIEYYGIEEVTINSLPKEVYLKRLKESIECYFEDFDTALDCLYSEFEENVTTEALLIEYTKHLIDEGNIFTACHILNEINENEPTNYYYYNYSTGSLTKPKALEDVEDIIDVLFEEFNF